MTPAVMHGADSLVRGLILGMVVSPVLVGICGALPVEWVAVECHSEAVPV
jgi:hypothetical protein